MGEESFITPEIKALIGKEESFSSTEEIGRATIHRFAVAVGEPNPLYWDEEFAKQTRYGGIVAPPTMIFELNHNTGVELEEDGGYADRITLRPPLTNFVRGGNEYEIFQPVRPTDKVTIKRKISQIYEKKGKTSVLVFVITEFRYINQEGKLLGINRETFIFMPAKGS